MMEHSENKKYSVSDIERYHTGKMSAAEMHALEMAALDDPFLADAIEGYQLTSEPKEDVNRLQQRLQQNLNKKRTGSLIKRNYSFMKIAALLVLLAGGGWFLYRLLGPVNKNMAVTGQSIKKEVSTDKGLMDTSVSTISQDSITVPVEPIKENRNKIAGRSHVKKIRKDPESNSPGSNSDNHEIEKDLSNQNEAKISYGKSKNDGAIALKRYNAEPSASTSKIPEKLSDTSNVLASAKPVTDNKVINDTLRNVNVMLKPNSSNLSEVVVASKYSQRKASTNPFVKLDSLEPAQGWAQYNDYIASNLKAPEDIKLKNISGDVQLSFEVNKDGDPINIKVEKSLSDKSDQEAIRLLKEGPKWKKKKNRKDKITIHF